MKIGQSRTTSVLLAVAVLIGGANVAAFAATGGNFKLGLTNKANQPSTLVNTGAGPALKIKTRPAAPPLAVSSSTKVAKLNADRLDGIEGAALQTRSTMYRIPAEAVVGGFTITFPRLAPGIYQATFSVIASMTSSGDNINCLFEHVGGTSEFISYGAVTSGFSSANASGILDTRSQPAQLRCFTGTGAMTVDPDSGSRSMVSFTRVDVLTTGATPVAARPSRSLAKSSD